MLDSVPDRIRIRSHPAPHDRRSARPPRAGRDGAPVAGAPGWYVVRRKSRALVLLDHLLRRRRRYRLLAVAGAAGSAVLALLFSLSFPYWGGAGTERRAATSTPPVASSQDAGPQRPAAASADSPPISPAPAGVATGQAPRGQRDASATTEPRAKAEPAPPQDPTAVRLTSREGPAFTAQVQGRPRPLAATAQSQSAAGGTAARVQLAEPHSRQAPASPPQPGARPVSPAATAPAQAAGETSSSTVPPPKPAPRVAAAVAGEAVPSKDSPASAALTTTVQVTGAASATADRAAPGAIRVFIHHTANRGGDAALAQRLADHLRGQGFTGADIRAVDFSIGKASVRYFFDDDRSASERLVEELGRFLEGAASRAPDHATDFTHFTPKPRSGNVEVWLPAS
jgi:hypothetical protein